jgi:hypothetical protein
MKRITFPSGGFIDFDKDDFPTMVCIVNEGDGMNLLDTMKKLPASARENYAWAIGLSHQLSEIAKNIEAGPAQEHLTNAGLHVANANKALGLYRDCLEMLPRSERQIWVDELQDLIDEGLVGDIKRDHVEIQCALADYARAVEIKFIPKTERRPPSQPINVRIDAISTPEGRVSTLYVLQALIKMAY